MLEKKFFSLLLSILLLSSIVFSGCDKDSKDYSTNISSTDIALVTLFSYEGDTNFSWGLANLGHAFVSVNNISDQPITINNITINANDTITIGTWSLSKHFGIWINVESNYIRYNNKYNGRFSITTGISEEDITKISSFMQSADHWGALKNCSYFANNFWNLIADENEKINTPWICSPKKLADSIKKFPDYKINQEINTSEYCFYFDGDIYQQFQFKGDK